MNITAAVENGKVVFLHYTLTNDAGEVLDSSLDSEPLYYLQGADNIVPGLESALLGHKVGDKLKVRVAPEQGYGERIEQSPMPVERHFFPDDMPIEVGMTFITDGPEGQVPMWVAAVEDDKVFLDVNHPLAGVTLHFDVEIVNLRDATEEELEHGHPHGPTGTEPHDHDHDWDEDEDDFEDDDEDGEEEEEEEDKVN